MPSCFCDAVKIRQLSLLQMIQMIARAAMKVMASLFSVQHQGVLIALLLLMTIHLLIQIVHLEWA